MNTKRKLFAFLLVAGVALGSGVVTGQSMTTGAIRGVVTDAESGDPLPGVAVVVSSTALQGTQAALTDASGQFKITNLPPGVYLVTYYYLGVTVRRANVSVSINKSTPAYIRFDTGRAEGEVITVGGRAPAIDPTSTTQGVTLDESYTRNLPVPGRTFDEALGAAAGAAGDDLGVSFSGSTSPENLYVVDGVNTTGLVRGGVGTPLVNEFIEEVEIVTGGYNAELGRSTGGVVNVVTKSGTNELHGSLFSYVSTGYLAAASKQDQNQAGSIDAEGNLAYDFDLGAELGGPIVKDAVWFYVGFAPQLSRQRIDRITRRRTDCRALADDLALSACDAERYADGEPDTDPDTGELVYEELDRQRLTADNAIYQAVGKLNVALAPEHQGQISFIGAPTVGSDVEVFGAPSATRLDYFDLTTDVSARWTSKLDRSRTEIETVVGWHRATSRAKSPDAVANQTPRQNLFYGSLGSLGQLGGESVATLAGCTDGSADDPYPEIDNCPDGGNGYSIGGPGYLTDDREQRLSASLSMIQRARALGHHEIKAGVDVEDNLLTTRREMSGDMYFDINLPTGDSPGETLVYRWVEIASGESAAGFDDVCLDDDGIDVPCRHLGGTDVAGETINWAAYLRDSWQVLPNLTFNYGVRYEEQRLRYAEALRGSVDPFTGERIPVNALVMRNMWAPRLGVLYDWTAEGRSKVYAHWGRFFESIPMELNRVNLGGETTYLQGFTPSACGEAVPALGVADGVGCITSGAPADWSTFWGSGLLVAPGVKPQYMDEVIVGTEYELLDDLTVGLSYQYRRLGRALEDISPDGLQTYVMANPGEWPAEEEAKLVAELDRTVDPEERAQLEELLGVYQTIREFDKPRRNYHAVQLTANKRFGKQLYAQASYTYSRLSGNFPGLYAPDSGQSMPNISAQYDLFELLANRDGLLPHDRTHYVKLDGYYQRGIGMAGTATVGGRVRAVSGTPVSALGGHFWYGADESLLLPRGALGRSAFDARFDLHLGYRRAFGHGTSLEVFADLFNLLNRQSEAIADQTYTRDPVNPIVGGEYEDLLWAKTQDWDGSEPADPVLPTKNRNFLRPKARQSPFTARFGARVVF